MALCQLQIYHDFPIFVGLCVQLQRKPDLILSKSMLILVAIYLILNQAATFLP